MLDRIVGFDIEYCSILQ